MSDPYMCPRCVARPKDWVGSDPVCGFDADGSFRARNWNCATLGELRDMAEAEQYHVLWHEDSNAVLMKGPEYDDGRAGPYVLLRWYKQRGRTEWALLWEGGQLPRPITLAEAERVLTT
jgi:hypothetical protein